MWAHCNVESQQRAKGRKGATHVWIDSEVLLRSVASLDILARREEVLALDYGRFGRLGILLAKRLDTEGEGLKEGGELGVDGGLTARHRPADRKAGDGVRVSGSKREIG